MTILNEFTIYNIWFFVSAFSGIIAITMIISAAQVGFKDGDWSSAGDLFVWFLIFGLFTFVTNRAGTDIDGTFHRKCHRMEVAINDTVPFTEVIQQYKVVEARGNIYVLEERDDWEKGE